jgi:hypothetical protein
LPAAELTQEIKEVADPLVSENLLCVVKSQVPDPPVPAVVPLESQVKVAEDAKPKDALSKVTTPEPIAVVQLAEFEIA